MNTQHQNDNRKEEKLEDKENKGIIKLRNLMTKLRK